MQQRHWVLWDGDCGFCRRSAMWLRGRDAKGVFQFVPYQSAPSPPMTARLYKACRWSVHVVKTDGVVLRGGQAALFVLEKTGWGVWARLFMYPPLNLIAEAVYRTVARNRALLSRYFFKSEVAE